MAAHKGHAKVGGRQKGTPNKKTVELEAMLSQMGVDPFEIMGKIAAGELPCTVCRGEGKTKFQPAHGQSKLCSRTCESCYGSGQEKISPELRGKMSAELAQYLKPKRKAIEVSGTDGEPIKTTVTVVFGRADATPSA